jgi:intraflagellar transport protein 81
MEMIGACVARLNQPPFSKGYASMSELDGKRPLELLDILCEVIGEINPDERSILQEATDMRVERIIGFLSVMKFNIPDEEQFRQSMLNGDKDTMTIVLHDMLQAFDRYKKRAYLGKYLMPMDIPPEFRNEDLVLDLEARLKDMQGEFKETHREVEKVRAQHGGSSPSDLKTEISQLESERSQLQVKIQRLKKEKEALGDDDYFHEMLRVTSNLRKEQEEEMRVMERMKENRQALQAAEVRYNDSSKRLTEARQAGAGNQTAEQILSKLERDVRELNARRESIESTLSEREQYMERMMGWEQSDRVLTADDVREKRIQLEELEGQVRSMNDRLDSALERNNKLVVFRQASTMAQRKLREKEDDLDRLADERRRLMRQMEEKEAQAQACGETPNRLGKMDLKRYGAVVREKIDKYRKMREELSALRAELVVLQRTEQILKSRHKNLDSVLEDLERRKGVEGYRDTQKALVEMSEKTAEVDQMKGATLDQISTMVEQISREFRQKQTQLQPLMSKLKGVRHEYMEVEADFSEKKSSFDKIAVGLEMEKSVLERECDTYQVLYLAPYIYNLCVFFRPCLLFLSCHPSRRPNCSQPRPARFAPMGCGSRQLSYIPPMGRPTPAAALSCRSG